MNYQHAIPWIAALVLTLILFLLGSYAFKVIKSAKFTINPLKITAESNGRASLSRLQVLFFTMIVIFLVTYWICYGAISDNTQIPQLLPLNETILLLLGIAVGGTISGRATNTARDRLSGENWSWLKSRKWIKQDLYKNSTDRIPSVA